MTLWSTYIQKKTGVDIFLNFSHECEGDMYGYGSI